MKYLNETGLRPGVESPYKDFVPPEDLKEIYKKGTMYDLNYLFKAIQGAGATFTSSLNGLTADRGWLNNAAVELHLGAGLRYRVRVSQLNVSHAMFTPNMVPILTDVAFVCTRFYDNATAADDQKTLATLSTGTIDPSNYPKAKK